MLLQNVVHVPLLMTLPYGQEMQLLESGPSHSLQLWWQFWQVASASGNSPEAQVETHEPLANGTT